MSQRKLQFEPRAYQEFVDWAAYDKRMFKKLTKLVQETLRNPFAGTGKPEPLKHDLSGAWSQRITLEHRLVYLVTDTALIIIPCKSHYH